MVFAVTLSIVVWDHNSYVSDYSFGDIPYYTRLMQYVCKYAYHGASITIGIPVFLGLPNKIDETGCANLFLL